MRLIKYPLMALALAMLCTTHVQAKAKQAPKAYMYGFVANFTDSVVYFTDIQEVDSVWYDDKTKFLLGRNNYAEQLRSYFATELKMPHRTCVAVFCLTRKEAEKKYVKLRKQYTVKHAGQYDVRNLNENDFHFRALEFSDEELNLQSTKAQKPKKDKKKGGKGDPRGGKKGGQLPPPPKK